MAACSANKAGGNKCVPCEGLDASARLTLEQAQAELLSSMSVQPSIWTIQDTTGNAADDGSNNDDDGSRVLVLKLTRSFTAKSFQAALDAINAMGAIAEREGHHPDFHLTNYRNVRIDIYTHSLQGLSKNDLVLANMIDTEVKIQYSPKWLKENAHVKPTSKE